MLQNCSSKQNNGRNVLLLFTSILFPYECNTGSEGGFRQIFFPEYKRHEFYEDPISRHLSLVHQASMYDLTSHSC